MAPPADDGTLVIPKLSVSKKGKQRWRKLFIVVRSFRFTKNRRFSAEELTIMMREHDVRILEGYGGIYGLAGLLNTSLDSGIHSDSVQILKQRDNIYPGQSRKGFFNLLLDAFKHPAFFYCFQWAVLHLLSSGIKSDGLHEAAAIAVLVILSSLVTSFTYYMQGLQYVRNENKANQKILVDVVRGGAKMQIPICDLVVGDIAFLESGDQVPADGLFVGDHSLWVDESTLTGESGLIPVNQEKPFLRLGCKVMEGGGKMLVTGVGINTEWRCFPNEMMQFQKFIQFQLNVNVAALLLNFITAVSVGDVPLTAVQLLWVNLIMDTLGALALATEPPTDEVLQRFPVQCEEPLLSNSMIRNLVLQALYQVVILLTLQFRSKDILGLKGPDAINISRTIVFNTFVFCQLFNMMNARKPEDWNILKVLFDKICFVGIMCIILLQVIVVEFFSEFACTVKLSWQHWLICIVIGFSAWPVAFLGKLISGSKKSQCTTSVGPVCG